MRTATSALVLAAALAITGCSSGDDTAGTADTDTTATTDSSSDGSSSDDGGDAAGGSLTFVGTDDIAWEQDEKSVAPGSVEVTIECGSSVGHALAIEGVQDGSDLAACGADGSGSGTVQLEAGEYTYFCTVPGHRDAGMEGTLTVG